ncbi:IS256 family transposase [Streptomyces sp. ITFR-21]|nr:IS256 family transposase [Streptomyces sp. ITFR-21]WNI19582.1 IS256 family transposase [Streptomyces sp. ITFR-21]
MLVERARSEGVQLTGAGGLLQQLAKRVLEGVLEAVLEGEITGHLGYGKHDPAGKNSGSSRNGTRAKTVLTDVGPVEGKVPRDVEGSFEPQTVRKRRRRLTGVDEMVLSLSAKGPTHGEISAHLAGVYGAGVSKQTISTITGQVMDGMAERQNRPLDRVCPVLFVDAVNVKIRDGKVANRPVSVVMAVTAEGTRDILGIWAGDGGGGAQYWLQVFTGLRNRGLDDVLMPVCDGLKGLPDAVGTVWPRTIVQKCIVHLLRNSFRYASRADWDKTAKALKPVYTAPNQSAAGERFGEFQDAWGKKYPAIVQLWESAWAESVPFLSFDVEIRTVICPTNAIESVNARIRKPVRARGHFPTEAAALKCVYMALMSLDPTGKGRKRWTMRWIAPLNAFQIAFEGRLTPANN